MVRVLGLVSFRIFPTHMGGQKGVALFYEYLRKYAEVVLAGSSDNVPTDKITMNRVLYPNKKMYRNFFKVDELSKMVKDENIDIIIAEHSYTAWMAWLLQKRTGKPFIIHSHNIESRRFQKMNKWWWKVYYGYEKWIHRRSAHNFFISEEDRNIAISEFGIQGKDCTVITYGVQHIQIQKDKKQLRKQLGIKENQAILLFNGTLDYEPNYEAVVTLINEVEPLLRKKLDHFRIMITGNRAPATLANLMLNASNLEYLGYVEDVNLYYQCADLFINPVANDSGVKTKLIEAIANNCTAVSTEAGASGINKKACGNKLVIARDNNWATFTDAIVSSLLSEPTDTPQDFYDHYSWENIASAAASKIESLVNKTDSQV